jgi:fructose-1,6-bisphosphatase/inositol monophosphatase family enzyme
MAAGILLVKEAGGMITTPSGRSPSLDGDDVIAGNQSAYSILKSLIIDKKQDIAAAVTAVDQTSP